MLLLVLVSKRELISRHITVCYPVTLEIPGKLYTAAEDMFSAPRITTGPCF